MKWVYTDSMNGDKHETHAQSSCVTDVQRYIFQNAEEELSREGLAEMAGYSLPHFHRIFTAEIGENISTYIRRVRLERAARKLMMGAVDLTQVAMGAGYQTHAAFSKAFKQRYGYTPSQFRTLNFMVALETIKEAKVGKKRKTA